MSCEWFDLGFYSVFIIFFTEHEPEIQHRIASLIVQFLNGA